MKIAYNMQEAWIPEYENFNNYANHYGALEGIMSNRNIYVYSYKWLPWLKFSVASNTEPSTLIDTLITSMHPRIC